MAPPLHRPSPILRNNALAIDRTANLKRAAGQLIGGDALLVTDSYDTGLRILSHLRALLPAPAEDAGYEARRAHQRAWKAAARHLLVPVVRHQIPLEKAPAIGFMPDLYPKHHTFALPLTEVQELHLAWKWYQDGVHLAVLGHRLHPFYGTYAPTRTTHLELFATWLSQYTGSLSRVIDVGTGCGVLALMLSKAGAEKVLATDTNPNAVESLRRELGRLQSPQITPRHGDLLGGTTRPVDLIVFNPPWTQGDVESPLDGALYFEDPRLFEQFFDQASAQLNPDGRVVLLFSNIMSLVQPELPHPIEAELARGRFTLVQKLHRKVKASTTRGGRRRKTRERVEVWELALA